MHDPYEYDPDPASSQSELVGVVQPPEPHSHDFEMIVNMQGDLLRIVCAECDAAWKCEPI